MSIPIFLSRLVGVCEALNAFCNLLGYDATLGFDSFF